MAGTPPPLAGHSGKAQGTLTESCHVEGLAVLQNPVGQVGAAGVQEPALLGMPSISLQQQVYSHDCSEHCRAVLDR